MAHVQAVLSLTGVFPDQFERIPSHEELAVWSEACAEYAGQIEIALASLRKAAASGESPESQARRLGSLIRGGENVLRVHGFPSVEHLLRSAERVEPVVRGLGRQLPSSVLRAASLVVKELGRVRHLQHEWDTTLHALERTMGGQEAEQLPSASTTNKARLRPGEAIDPFTARCMENGREREFRSSELAGGGQSHVLVFLRHFG
jgi:hypothetical protein